MTSILRLAAAIVFATVPCSARAAIIPVPAGDEAALVDAIDTANANGEDDTITLGAGSTYSFTAADNPMNALPVVTSRITIQGNDAIVTRGGGPEFRLFEVGGTGDLTLDRLTVRGGSVTFNAPLVQFNDGGGGIRILGNGKLTLTNAVVSDNSCNGNVCQGGGILVYEQGVQGGAQPVLTLIDSVVRDNFAGTGGGISLRHNHQTLVLTRTVVRDNEGIEGGGLTCNGSDTVTITDSTFIGNSVSELVEGGALGGGLLDYGGSTYTITGSTFTGNSATGDSPLTGATNVAGGAIAESGGATLTITNSTITGNAVTNTGPGLVSGSGLHGQAGGTWTLNNVTIAGNTVNGTGGSGAGIDILSGDVTIRNSIVFGNTATTAADCSVAGDAFSTITSQGHNIVGTIDGCAYTAATGDQVGVDPLLGPLADNGGTTQTRALLAGSPALDQGDPAAPGSGGTACEAVDQRGTTRPQGPACDIGAFELGGPTTTTTIPTGCGVRAPTFVSIDCRLDILIADLGSATDLGKVKTSLLRSATLARDKKIAAETTDPANAKKVKKLLKKAIRKMISYGFRIRSRNAVRAIPDDARREALRTAGAEIQEDMKTLMRSL